MDGWINLDKPAGISSAKAVTRVKRLLPRKMKIGHAGTLDPFATGVLVVLIGKATRLCERFMAEPKQYEATVKLGATTATLDPTSAEIATPTIAPPPGEAIEAVMGRFIGTIQQRPPAYSAIKRGGVAAYQMARQGRELELAARPVVVYGIEIVDYEWPMLRLRIDCGRGTYIRSLARDIGEALGTAGYVAELRRTRVGPAVVGESVTLERLAQEGLEAHLRGATLD